MKKTDVIHKSGKRKRATARATLKKGKGKVKVNGVFLDNFGDRVSQLRIKEPLVLAGEIANKVDIFVRVQGGGINGQSDAVRLAIARALVEHDKKLETVFDDYDRLLLVADVRRKEVCKPNISKARAKRQKSYR
jgi:small subunit ribosomal protein S9